MRKSKTVASRKTISLRTPAPAPRQSRLEPEAPPASAPPSSRSNGNGIANDVELSDVVAFVRVVDAGSFTRAAEKSAWPKSALSRRVARLEQSLGVRLLQRTTRSLSLTETGSSYYERASAALTQLDEARELASDTLEDPSGIVRITAPVDIGAGPLSRVLSEFTRKYPKIHLEVDATPRIVDLVGEGFDLAIRAGRLRDSSLVARKLGESPQLLVATKGYLDRTGRPKKLEELAEHACILFRSTKGEAVWKLVGPKGEESVKVRGPLSGTDFAFVASAALQGAGIGFVPLPAAFEHFESGTLEWVLPGYMGAASPIHLVYPSARFVPHRVAVLRDFLAQHLRFECPSKDHRACAKSIAAARGD